MLLENIPQALAQELNIRPEQAKAAIKLLDEGNTVPFIARYRKEATGELEDEQLRKLEERLAYLRNFVKRQEEILNKIAEQGKLTEELQQAIEKTTKLQELEDIYLPFKQKKRTRAQKAREKGLEPLSTTILWQKDTKGSVEKEASKYIKPELAGSYGGRQRYYCRNHFRERQVATKAAGIHSPAWPNLHPYG